MAGISGTSLPKMKPKREACLISTIFSGAMVLLMAEILHQLRLVVYPIINRILYIPGG